MSVIQILKTEVDEGRLHIIQAVNRLVRLGGHTPKKAFELLR